MVLKAPFFIIFGSQLIFTIFFGEDIASFNLGKNTCKSLNNKANVVKKTIKATNSINSESQKAKTTEILNVPDVYLKNQGGLLDIELHPNFDQNKTIFFSYSKGNKEDGANTAVASAKLINNSLEEIKVLYHGEEQTKSSLHWGCRLQFDNYGYLFFAIGDRGNRNKNPQDITLDGGKVYRINEDGSIPIDNPFINENGAKTAIYS